MSVRSTGNRAEQSAPQTAHYFVCAARGHFCFLFFGGFQRRCAKGQIQIHFYISKRQRSHGKQAPCHCRDTVDSQFGATQRRKGEIFFGT